ncbi:hypothetical protein N4P33_07870 [Streptomyces sp. 15-116A]|uniref:hypothetical protein n=1 Tax=Streptomyces sp. 15-116A TaxID=2259035 RepID=UPI0021B413EE|nr:hypothetical protein [Streptomyces sp. 15-116A]MCT7352090.1 hypothetical protein [Streptomyces sp. 15-116A]
MAGGRFRARDAWGVAGFVLFLVVGLVVVLLFFGGARWLGREAISALVGIPGGAWAAGAVLGIVSVLGWFGALARSGVANGDSEPRLLRAARSAGTAACWVAAMGPVLLLLSGLRGRNCRSSSCEYVPGTGTAFLAYVVTVTALGLLGRRWRRGVLEARRAEERDRMRKLRKKGKGKSRAARQVNG